MINSINNSYVAQKMPNKFGIVVWITILLSIGIFFRTRPADVVPVIDWVILFQLFTCIAGLIVGIWLLRKRLQSFEFASKVFLFYILAVFCSTLFSSFPKIVLGYWVLLLGSGLLTMALVYTSRDMTDLIKLEKIWFFTCALIILTNSATSYLFTAQPGVKYTGVFRLGMGWVHASHLGYLSSFVFSISFFPSKARSRYFLWMIRCLLFVVILLSRTRVPIIICIVALLMQFGLKHRQRSLICASIASFSLFAVIGFTLTLFLGFPWAVNLFDFINRGDLSTLATFTGRFFVWKHALSLVFSDILRIIFGYGYGISRFSLNDPSSGLLSYFGHVHNSFIENLFSMGIIGFLPFILISVYLITWLTDFRHRVSEFSVPFAVRAATVTLAFLISSIFVVPVGAKIRPFTLIIIFYMFALDRRKHLSSNSEDH